MALLDVIGGADGPTAIYVTESFLPTVATMVGAALSCGIILWLYYRRKK